MDSHCDVFRDLTHTRKGDRLSQTNRESLISPVNKPFRFLLLLPLCCERKKKNVFLSVFLIMQFHFNQLKIDSHGSFQPPANGHACLALTHNSLGLIMETSQLRDRLCFAVETSSELCAQKVLKGSRLCLHRCCCLSFLFLGSFSPCIKAVRVNPSQTKDEKLRMFAWGNISENVPFMSSRYASRFQ